MTHNEYITRRHVKSNTETGLNHETRLTAINYKQLNDEKADKTASAESEHFTTVSTG